MKKRETCLWKGSVRLFKIEKCALHSSSPVCCAGFKVSRDCPGPRLLPVYLISPIPGEARIETT